MYIVFVNTDYAYFGPFYSVEEAEKFITYIGYEGNVYIYKLQSPK